MEQQKFFLFFANNFSQTFLALFDEHPTCISTKSTPNKKTSAQLIPLLDSLLCENNISLADITFIAANRGPAPFTTLRTVLATVNGLAQATKIPLIGVDTFSTFLEELATKNSHFDGTFVIIQNAFCNDLYYAIYDARKKKQLSLGVAPQQKVFSEIEQIKGPVIFAGNAAPTENEMYPLLFPDIKTFGTLALRAFAEEKQEQVLTPLYLKDPFVSMT